MLSKDTLIKIALELDNIDLIKLCQTNKNQ